MVGNMEIKEETIKKYRVIFNRSGYTAYHLDFDTIKDAEDCIKDLENIDKEKGEYIFMQ